LANLTTHGLTNLTTHRLADGIVTRNNGSNTSGNTVINGVTRIGRLGGGLKVDVVVAEILDVCDLGAVLELVLLALYRRSETKLAIFILPPRDKN